MEFRPSEYFLDLIQNAQESTFHMEVRDTYAEPEESEPLRRFINGDPEPPNGYDKDDWIELVETLTGRGVSMSRIRVVSVPHSDYQRWLLSVAGSSVQAGEDIRYLPRRRIHPKDVPADDWWLLDGQRVAFNLVNENGKPAGAAITDDLGIAAYCRSVKERLWSLATPYREYVNESTVNTAQ